jgi:predicted house-cleaning noncanonical NTP pyrophosphatase (MazG superfamily)
MKNINENYRELIRDKTLDKINKRFLISKDGNAVPIDYKPAKPSLENKIKQKQIEFIDEEEEEEIKENQIEEVEN